MTKEEQIEMYFRIEQRARAARGYLMTHDLMDMTPEEKEAEDGLIEGLAPCARMAEFAIIEIPDLKGTFKQ